jgi:CO/xanthine dehydrogenase FAD-binding subunit
MRGYTPDYEMCSPDRLDQALNRLSNEPGVWRPFAGGTDLMVLLEADQLPFRKFIDLSRLPELRGIHSTKEEISMGALTTYSEVAQSEILNREFPLLGRAALETGAIAIQNRGTLGGNIANASPAADTPPALLVYDAEIRLVSTQGLRVVPYSTFHTAYKKTLLRSNELIHSVTLKRSEGEKYEYYRKVGARRAQAISKVCLAGLIRTENAQSTDDPRDSLPSRGPKRKITHVRLAIGSVGPTPQRLISTENALFGKELRPDVLDAARKILEREIVPLDDIRSTAEYRLKVAGNLLEEFLAQVQSG